MKTHLHKINSIHYGGKVIALGSVLVVLALLMRFVLHLYIAWIPVLVLGCIVLLGITIWMVIESFQDQYWNQYFCERMNTRILLSDRTYECQNCGNRSIRKQDKSCGVCGIRFREDEDIEE